MGATVVVRSVGGERFTQEIRVGSHTLLGDEPASVGDADQPRKTLEAPEPAGAGEGGAPARCAGDLSDCDSSCPEPGKTVRAREDEKISAK